MKDSGAVVVHGASGPHYAPRADKIGMPYPERFVSSEAYYAALTHELAHWTGHETRLARDLTGAFGSESYAREEVFAELASHVLGVELQIGHDPTQHAAYIHHWIKIAKEDPSFVYTAAASAEKICDFLGLERYSYEPLPQVEQAQEVEEGVSDRDATVPALEGVVAMPMQQVSEMAI